MEQNSASPAWFRSTSQPGECSQRTRHVGIDTSVACRLLIIFSSRSEELDWTVRKSGGHSMCCCLDRQVYVANPLAMDRACTIFAIDLLCRRWWSGIAVAKMSSDVFLFFLPISDTSI